MRTLFECQLSLAEALPTDSDRFQHLQSVLRSLYQAAAITALEIVRELTPQPEDDVSISALVRRFSQPSDGLPVEVLEACTPVIRSYVARTYNTGWFEPGGSDGTTLARDATAWVSFRNKKPGHGVVSKADIEEWAPRLAALLRRSISCLTPALPQISPSQTIAHVGTYELVVQTPLTLGGQPIVISAVEPRKGVWKLEGQTVEWECSKSFTTDLPPNSMFEEMTSNFPEKFDIRTIDVNGQNALVFSNVPIRQTSVFEGRLKELDTLFNWLNDSDGLRHCLVFGDGGIGKTTLTLEFLNRILESSETLSGKPPSVISYYSAKMNRWSDQGVVNLRGVSDAMEDCVRELMFVLTPVLTKDYYKLSGTALIDRVASEFNQQGFSRDDILLVLDNTETLANSPNEVTEFSVFLKQVGKRLGRVLMTSRRREFVAFEPLQISSLSEAEAVSLMRRLADEYVAIAIKQAGEATLRRAAKQLTNKPLLIDTLVKYLARSPVGIDQAIDQVFRKTNDQLLEFLYDDAWLRITELQQDVFLVLVSAAVPLDNLSVGDACVLVGIQHVEFQKALDETYFGNVTDYGDRYELQIVELAGRYFQKQLQHRSEADRRRIHDFALKVDAQANHRQRAELNYRQDRVAEAFRGAFAKAAKIAAQQGDLGSAEENFRLALEDEPMNAALHDRFAWFVLHRCHRADDARKLAERAIELDPRSADASLTLALCWYRLGELRKGDDEMERARNKGKPQSLCALRMAIARFYVVKDAPYAREAQERLREGKGLIGQVIKALVPEDRFFSKNMQEARKYERMFFDLEYKIRTRKIEAKDGKA